MAPNNHDGGGAGNSDGFTDEEFFEFYGVPRQESYECAACGKTAYPPSENTDHFDLNAAYIEYIEGQETPVMICFECIERGDWEERAKRRQTIDSRTSPRHGSVQKILEAPASSRFSKILGLDWDYERQTSLAIEHWLFIVRLAAVTAGALLVLVGVAIFAGVSGSIFVSMTTGQIGRAWCRERVHCEV